MTNFKLEPENIVQVITGAKFAASAALVARQAITIIPGRKGDIDGKYKTGTDVNDTTMLQRPGAPFSEVAATSFAWQSFHLHQDARNFTMTDWEIFGDRDGEYRDTTLARVLLSMANKEDKIIMKGYYNVGGVAVSGATGYEAAAVNTHGAAATWITFGNPFTDVLTAVMKFGDKKLDVSPIGKKNIYVYCGLDRYVALSNLDGNGVSSLYHLTNDLGIPAENILPSGNITAGVAMVVYKHPDYAQMTIPEDMDVKEPWALGPTTYRWEARHIFGFKIMNTDSVYKITGV